MIFYSLVYTKNILKLNKKKLYKYIKMCYNILVKKIRKIKEGS